MHPWNTAFKNVFAPMKKAKGHVTAILGCSWVCWLAVTGSVFDSKDGSSLSQWEETFQVQ